MEGRYAPKTCYICSGRKRIPVVVDYDRNNDPIMGESVCVRCKGDGVITDGFDLDRVLSITPPRNPNRCICNYEIDGPMGNPNCKGR